MKKTTSGAILLFLLAVLIAAAGCTTSAPLATTPAATPAATTADTAPYTATAESTVRFGETIAQTLDGVNEVLEYVASGDEAERTEALETFVEAGIAADRFRDSFVALQPSVEQRTAYIVVDDTRTATTVSAVAIIREFDANGKVTARNIQKFEDDFEAMRAAYTQYGDTYYAAVPAKDLDPSTATGAAIALRKMQADLMIAVSESLEYALIAEPEERADFDAAMDRFETQAAAFSAAPFLNAEGNEAIALQYADMMKAEKEFRVAADKVFSNYDTYGKITPETFSAFEAATDNLRASYNTLMASVMAKA